MVRPKESMAPLSWRDAGAVMEESRASFQEELAFNDQTVYSYQQINCLDSVIRYVCVFSRGIHFGSVGVQICRHHADAICVFCWSLER